MVLSVSSRSRFSESHAPTARLLLLFVYWHWRELEDSKEPRVELVSRCPSFLKSSQINDKPAKRSNRRPTIYDELFCFTRDFSRIRSTSVTRPVCWHNDHDEERVSRDRTHPHAWIVPLPARERQFRLQEAEPEAELATWAAHKSLHSFIAGLTRLLHTRSSSLLTRALTARRLCRESRFALEKPSFSFLLLTAAYTQPMVIQDTLLLPLMFLFDHRFDVVKKRMGWTEE